MIDFNLNTARFICLASSLLCIPAFYFGTAVAWSVVMALGALILLKAHLQNIINRYDGWDDKKARCIATLKYYGRMTLEISAINTIGPVLSVYLGIQYVPSNFDQTVLDYSPLHWGLIWLCNHGDTYDLAIQNPVFSIVIHTSNAAIVWFISALFFFRHQTKITIEYVLYPSSIFNKNEEQSKSVKRLLKYDFLADSVGILYLTLSFFIPLFICLIFEQALIRLGTALLCLIILWVLIALAYFLHFIWVMATDKSFYTRE